MVRSKRTMEKAPSVSLQRLDHAMIAWNEMSSGKCRKPENSRQLTVRLSAHHSSQMVLCAKIAIEATLSESV